MKIEEFEVAPGLYAHPETRPLFIAEISANHLRDAKLFIETLRAAKYAGADLLKIQCFKAERMAHPDAMVKTVMSPWEGKSYLEMYRQSELPDHFYPLFFEFCRAEGLPGFASVFHPKDVDFIEAWNPPCYKIASPEINYRELIEVVAETQKPAIVSLGAASRLEIMEAVEILEKADAHYLLMHCSSEYPLHPFRANLATIPMLQTMFRRAVGYSDHTQGMGTAIAAVTLGAAVIEKHFILDRSLESLDKDFSVDQEGFSAMAEACREARVAIGKPLLFPEGSESGREYKRGLYEDGRILRPFNGIHPRTRR
jgi:pseudaminic acid synthase